MEDIDKINLDNITDAIGSTVKEYKYVYPRLMEAYKEKWCDFEFDELDFIDEQIKNHLDNMEMHQNSFDHWKNVDFEIRDEKFRTEQDFLNLMTYFKVRIASHKKIISFLKTKKSELEAPKPPTPPENKESETKEYEHDDAGNNYLLSGIEDFLEPISKLMSADDYLILVNSLKTYFDKGAFPTLTKVITIKGRPNKKAIGWILNRIFDSQSRGVELPLLHFCKNNISLFKDVDFDQTHYLKSNLYAYLTTCTKYSTKET